MKFHSGGEWKNRKSRHRFDSGPLLCTYYAPILYSRPLLLFPSSLSVKSRLAAYRNCSFLFSLPSATTFDGFHRISFLAALALSLKRVQYVLCAYARKFKYLLFVIKFGGANRMGILHRDCAMQRDRVRRSAETAIFILIATSFFFSRTSSRCITLASIRCLFSVSRFRSVANPAGVLVPVSYHGQHSRSILLTF